jgi:erythromycin esterase
MDTHGWLTELTSIEPDAPFDDLEPLRELVGGARVVALGECAHFIEELWTVRRRLVRFLCERLGFRLIAAEFDLGEGEELAGWLAHPADTRDLRMVSRSAADWGMATTAHWLRSWGTPLGVRFAGLDAPNGGAAIAAMLAWVADALRALDPDAAPVLERIEPIVSSLSGTSVAASAEAWAAFGVAQQDALTAGLARLRQRVEFLDDVLVESGGRDRVVGLRRRLLALQCADYALRANEAMHRGAEAKLDTSARDRFMADSLLALLEREPAARVVLLAHNGHVQKQPVVWGDYLSAHPLGMYLHRMLGDAYRVIGTTTTGAVSSEMELDPSVPVGFRVVQAALDPPQPGSLEATLLAAGFGDLPTLASLHRASAAGLSFQRIRAQSGYLTCDVAAAYDAIISLPRLTVQHDLGF